VQAGVIIPLIVLIIAVVSLICIVAGIVIFKKSKWISIVLFSTPVLVVALPVGFMYYVFQSSTPESLSLHVKESGPASFAIEGGWTSRADFYSYRKDVLVFCMASQASSVEVDLPALEKQKDGILDLGVNRLRTENRTSFSYCKSYKVDQKEKYAIPFKLNNATSGDVEIFYIHTVVEPMDSPAYWFKKLDRAS